VVVAKPEDHAHVPKKLQRRHRHREGYGKKCKEDTARMNHGCYMPGDRVLIRTPARSAIAHKHISLFNLSSTNPQIFSFL
jgi:hypothetical protein